MPLSYRVALQGFSAFERSALASYFRLAADRTPAYQQADTLADARFAIVDADHAESVAAVQAAGRMADGVFIGAQAPDGAVAWMTRPIDPLHVLRELDAMVEASATVQRLASVRPLAGTPPSAPAQTARAPARHRVGPVPKRRATDSASTGFVAVPGPPAADAARGPDALVVDDSEIALRFLETRLHRLGVRTERAGTSSKAIELLSRKGYDFLFLDVDLGPDSELDGLSLCQHIKRHHRHVGGRSEPVVVMVSALHSEVDRARGALAGADAYLGKPLDEAVLARLLARHGALPGPARQP